MKKPPVAATNANHPTEIHEKKDLLETSDSLSAIFRAAGGGPEGVIVAVFFIFRHVGIFLII